MKGRHPLVPGGWRDSVLGDLEEEARTAGHGRWWLAWHLLRAVARLRWSLLAGSVVTDLRYAVRSIARAPWFAVGAILTFAVGFGVNLATFSAVDRILFRRAPYGNPGRIVAILPCPLGGHANCAYSQLFQLVDDIGARGTRTLGRLASVGISGRYDMTADAPPLSFIAATPNLLRVLDVRPILGRGPMDTEGHDPIEPALLSYDAWQRRFGASPSILGRLVGTAPKQARVIGVLPAGFIPPLSAILDSSWDGMVFSDNASIYEPVARLTPGATARAAQAEVNVMLSGIKPPPRWHGPTIIQVVPIDQSLFQTVSSTAWLIVAVVALLFLLATANLTALILARGQSRERDAAVRSALGASLARVTAATMAESLVICSVGAAIAWLAVALGSSALRSVLPAIFAQYAAGPLDLRVLGFTGGAAAVMTVAVALWPALHVAQTDVVAVLGRAATPGGRRWLAGRTLVTVEAAVGITVVLVAVLVTTSFSLLVDRGTGFQSDRLYEVGAVGPRMMRVTPQESLSRYRAMLDAVSRTPGVEGVVGEDQSPATNPFGELFSNDPGQPGARYELSAGGFAVLGTPLIAGREFTAGEVNAVAPVAMLNEAAAAVLAPGVPSADLIGRTIPLPGEQAREVVGVVPELRSRYGQLVPPQIFVPLGTTPRRYLQFLVRLAPGVPPNVEMISTRVSAAVGPVQVSMRSVVDELDYSLVEPRFRAVLLGTIAFCGLVLAAAGLYALTAFEVARRKREMGIRLALGATGRRLHWFVATDVLRPVLIGSLAGLVLTLWAVRFIRQFLYQINGREPGLYILAIAVLTLTAGLTAWLPARQAAQTDPASVLRTT